MSRVRAFQCLIVCSVVLHFAWLFLPDENAFPAMREALRWNGYGGTPLLQHPLLYVAFGVVKLLAAVGLVLFLSWGRWVLAGLVLVSVGQLLFNGLAVGLPHQNVVGALLGLIDGAVLALAFASPLGEAMRKDG